MREGPGRLGEIGQHALASSRSIVECRVEGSRRLEAASVGFASCQETLNQRKRRREDEQEAKFLEWQQLKRAASSS